MKRFLLLLLSICLCFTAIPCYALENADKITPSESTNNLKNIFADDLVNTYIKEDDGVIGIPVILTSFRRNAVESNGIVVLYVVGHAEERIGTDSDTDIVNDFLNEGYMVVVLDYLNNPEAVGLPLTKSAQTINAVDINSTKKYIDGYDAFTCYTVPSGHRIARNIYYFSLDTMAPYGVNEYIIETYNMYYAGKKKNNNGEYLKEATNLEECLKSDGTPINMDLSMFIVYPSNPKCTVPVFCLASSWESTEKEISSPRNFYFTHALFDGYAAVIYDHEYIPMSRDDHFGYLDARFTLGEYTANRVHSAAVRRVRYLAETYGYDAEYMTVMGFSKSGIGAGMLADKNHEEKGEHKTLDTYCPEGKSPLDSPAEQPWLYYEGTNERISSDLTVVYSGAGAGICTAREFCITENSVPFASSIGTEDDTAGFKYHIPLAQNYLDNLDIESLFLSVEGVGHAAPRIYSQAREADLFIVTWDFLDNHIRAAYRAEPPKVLYMFPKSGSFFDNMDAPIEIKFSRAMDAESLKNGIRVIRMADNKVIEGEWTAMHGNTTFIYSSALLIPGSKYKVEITDKCKAADGVALREEFTKTFAIAGDEFLTASKNTTTDGNVSDGISISPSAFGNHTSNLTFKREGGYGDVVRASLILNRTNNQNTQLKLEGDNFSLLHPVDNDIEIIDVSNYIRNTTGEEINFNLSSVSKSGTTLSYDFESGNKSDFKYKIGGTGSPVVSITNEAHSGNYAISMTKRNNDTRIKLIGATGSTKLTQSDLGLSLKISYYFKPVKSCSVVSGMYVESGAPYDAFDAVTYFAEAGKWTKINYSTVITQEMIDNNTTTFGISPLISCDVNIDDVVVEYDAGVTTFTSIEQAAASTNLLAPTLVLFTPKSADRELTNSAIVTSGELADTVIETEEFYVDSIADRDISNTKKGYLKMPISALSGSANKYTLNFCINTDGKSSVSVYGILGDDSRFAENFNSDITWNNAFANDISGYAVETDKVFGGEAITTVEATANGTFSIDVTSYVKSMKNAGYNAVTFIFVSNVNNEIITENFEKITEFASYSPSSRLTGFNIGLISGPDNPDNQVFYFDRSGTDGSNGTVNAYYQCLSFVGYLGTNKKWTSADIGVKYTVSFKQYNVSALENSGHTGAISGSNDLNYKSIPGVTRTVIPIDGSNTTANKWLQVTYTFTVTEEHVNKYSNCTSIIVSTGWKATRIYVDDLKVVKEGGNTSIDLATAPTLSDGTNTANYSLAATVDGANPDSAVTVTNSLPVSKTGVSGVQGITKAYYTFNKSDVQRIDEAKLTLKVEDATAGQKVLVYGLNAAVEGDICWTTAYANTATNKMNSSLVSSKTPIEVDLTSGTEQIIDVTDFVSERREDEKVSFAITAAEGVDKVVIKNVSLNISGSPSDTAESEAKITKPEGDVSENLVLISAESNHAIEKYVTNVEFYVNGKLHQDEIFKNGDTYHTYAKAIDGENNVYAVFTYTDNTTVTTETVTFEKIGEEYKKGDINGDGCVDAADLALLKKVIAKLVPLDSEEVKNTTVDENQGTPNAADLAHLKKIIAGLI